MIDRQKSSSKCTMSAVRQYVEKEKRYRQPRLTSADVARDLGIARSTLSKIVNEEHHMSFNDYVNLCRLRYAQRLLSRRKDGQTTEEITLLAGFSCASTFYRTLKKFKDYEIC